jgi:hypothetical protein
MNKFILGWCGTMFPYGVYRQWKCKMEPPYDLYSTRIIWSCLNGVCYTTPLGIFRLNDFANRIDIYYNNRDMKKYQSAYRELLGENYNII